MLKIRKFEFPDLNSILEIEKESFPKAPWSDAAFLEWHMHAPDGFLVAEKDGKVIGYIICSYEGYVVSVAVRKAERGEGVGTALFNAVVKRLGLNNARITLHCRVSNVDAIKFFESLGFKKVKRISNYYENGETAVEMVRT